MQFLKANTAVDVLIGSFVDTADGYTAITTGTIDVELSKNGQALANKNDVTAPTHDAAGTIDGYFNCELDATDTNTEGMLTLVAYVSTALPVKHEYMVLAEAAYDSLFTAKDTGYMDVNIKAVSEDTTAADNAEAFFDGTGYAGTNNVIPTVTTTTTATNLTNLPTIPANWLTAAGTAADFTTEVVAGMNDLDAAGIRSAVGLATANMDTQFTASATATGFATTAEIADVPTVAEFNARTLASASYFDPATDTVANVTTVGSVTNEVTADAVKFGGAAVTATTSVTIPAAATLATTTGAVGSVTGAVGSVTGHTNQTGDTYALANGATGFAAIDTVVDGIQTDLSNGTDGLGALKTLIDTVNTDLSNGTDGLGAIKTAVDGISSSASANLLQTGTITYTSQTSFTLSAGSTDDDAYNNQMIVITDTSPTTNKQVGLITDYVGSTKTITLAVDPGVFTMATGDTFDIIAVSGSSIGLQVDGSGYALLPTATQTSIDAIETDTGTTLQGELDAIQAAVITNAAGADIAADIIAIKAETATIVADTNELQTDDIPTLIAALQTDLDTLTDTSAEPTGVPAASATLLTKVGYLYMALRNQVDVTATKKTFYDDGGVAEWEKDLSDNGTTYSESEGNAI